MHVLVLKKKHRREQTWDSYAQQLSNSSWSFLKRLPLLTGRNLLPTPLHAWDCVCVCAGYIQLPGHLTFSQNMSWRSYQASLLRATDSSSFWGPPGIAKPAGRYYLCSVLRLPLHPVRDTNSLGSQPGGIYEMVEPPLLTALEPGTGWPGTALQPGLGLMSVSMSRGAQDSHISQPDWARNVCLEPFCRLSTHKVKDRLGTAPFGWYDRKANDTVQKSMVWNSCSTNRSDLTKLTQLGRKVRRKISCGFRNTCACRVRLLKSSRTRLCLASIHPSSYPVEGHRLFKFIL